MFFALATFLSVSFRLLSLIFFPSNRVPHLVWLFPSIFLATTTLWMIWIIFEANQLVYVWSIHIGEYGSTG